MDGLGVFLLSRWFLVLDAALFSRVASHDFVHHGLYDKREVPAGYDDQRIASQVKRRQFFALHDLAQAGKSGNRVLVDQGIFVARVLGLNMKLVKQAIWIL